MKRFFTFEPVKRHTGDVDSELGSPVSDYWWGPHLPTYRILFGNMIFQIVSRIIVTTNQIPKNQGTGSNVMSREKVLGDTA